jgi:hypothetical protein
MAFVGRVTPAHVGTRIVVRYRRRDDGGPTLTDVVGLLESFDVSTLTVRDRRGESVTIALADVFLAKPVPDAPPRRRPRAAPAE